MHFVPAGWFCCLSVAVDNVSGVRMSSLPVCEPGESLASFKAVMRIEDVIKNTSIADTVIDLLEVLARDGHLGAKRTRT